MQGGNLVMGFRQWEKEFDRHVKKGEKGIKIFADQVKFLCIGIDILGNRYRTHQHTRTHTGQQDRYLIE